MTLPVPFFGLNRQFDRHRSQFLSIIEEVLANGQVLQGAAVRRLEERVASLCGRAHARAVASCTDALTFSLLACGVQPGDEVLVTSFSFIASLSPILRVGAVPRFVDIDDRHFMIDLADAESKVTPHSRFLLAVHLFGQCLPFAEVEEFARRHRLVIIEDAAQAIGSSDCGRPAGSLGAASCFSFDPTKVVGAFGSGGIVLTDDEQVAERVGRLRYHGRDASSGRFVELGYNSQMPSEQAALLEYKLSHLPQWIDRRQQIAGLYREQLAGVPGLQLPEVRPDSTHSWHKLVVKAGQRERLRAALQQRQIQTRVHYPAPLSELSLTGRGERGVEGSLAGGPDRVPVAAQVCHQVLSLPIFPELEDEEVLLVTAAIREELGAA